MVGSTSKGQGGKRDGDVVGRGETDRAGEFRDGREFRDRREFRDGREASMGVQQEEQKARSGNRRAGSTERYSLFSVHDDDDE